MPEEQAFCTLVKIMFDYGLRDLFKLGLDVLHLRLYQLQRLTEVIANILWLLEKIALYTGTFYQDF